MPKSLYPKRNNHDELIAILIIMKWIFIFLAFVKIAFILCPPSSIYSII